MLVLASTSPYRRELLARLGLPFRTESPLVDETPSPNEEPSALAARLALAKAMAVADRLMLDRRNEASASNEASANNADRLIIGSDQVATLDGHSVIGKPGTHSRATEHLRAASGQKMAFHTALAMVDLSNGKILQDVVTTIVSFRILSDAQIEAYLLAEQPYDCAGAAKSEGLGVTLLESVDGPDATALIGLPLISLCTMLNAADCSPLGLKS